MSIILQKYEKVIKDIMSSILEENAELCHLSLFKIEQEIHQIKSLNSGDKKTIENVILLSYFLIFFSQNKIRNFINYQQSLMKYLEYKFTLEQRMGMVNLVFLKNLVRFVNLIDVVVVMNDMFNDQQRKTLNQVLQYLHIIEK
jgi:hypothetical protein